MFRLMMMLVTVALFSASGFAQEAKEGENALKDGDLFSTADTNGDGKVTLEEVKQHRNERLDALREIGNSDDPVQARKDFDAKYKDHMPLETFLRYDADDNKELTAEEFESYGMGDKPEFTGKDAEVYGDIHYDGWSRFAGQSGDELELTAFTERMAINRSALRTRAGDDLQKRYALSRSNSVLRDYHDLLLADADDNGIVTRTEAREYWRKSVNNELDAELTDEKSKLFAEQRFQDRIYALDANDDRILSREEVNRAYDAPTDDEWKKLDKDGDGQLNAEEIRNWKMDSDVRLRKGDGSDRSDRKGDGSDRPDRKGDGSDNPKRDADGKGGSDMPKR